MLPWVCWVVVPTACRLNLRSRCSHWESCCTAMLPEVGKGKGASIHRGVGTLSLPRGEIETKTRESDRRREPSVYKCLFFPLKREGFKALWPWVYFSLCPLSTLLLCNRFNPLVKRALAIAIETIDVMPIYALCALSAPLILLASLSITLTPLIRSQKKN